MEKVLAANYLNLGAVIRFLTFCGSLALLDLLTSGCCTVVSKSGDAKILRYPQIFIHDPSREHYEIDLPAVSIAQTGTHILRVRDLPLYLPGQFHFSLDMQVPEDEGLLDEKKAPWYDACIIVEFRKLDGTDIGRQVFFLGRSPHGNSQSRAGWDVGWNLLGAGPYYLDPEPMTDQSFDIVVDVIKASRRSTDTIKISGFAFVHKT